MWGLILGGIIALVAVGLLVEKRITGTHFAFMVALAVAVGSSVAHYGSTKKVSAGPGGFSWEAFEKQADAIKQKALDDIRTEVADQRKQLSGLIAEAQKTREDLEKVAEEAAPPLLCLKSQRQVASETGERRLLLEFESTKNKPFGTVVFHAEILNDTQATIRGLMVDALGGTYGNNETSENGKTATQEYIPIGNDLGLMVLVSAACKVRLSGSHMTEPLEFDIE
jgi:hypothetical protein